MRKNALTRISESSSTTPDLTQTSSTTNNSPTALATANISTNMEQHSHSQMENLNLAWAKKAATLTRKASFDEPTTLMPTSAKLKQEETPPVAASPRKLNSPMHLSSMPSSATMSSSNSANNVSTVTQIDPSQVEMIQS